MFVLAYLAAGIAGAVAQAVIGSCGMRQVVIELIAELCFLGAVLVWIRYVRGAPLAALGLPKRPLVDALTGVIAGGLLVIAAGAVVILTQAIASALLGHQPTQPQQVPGCVRGLSLSLVGPVVVLVAPLGEEALFRGFLYRGLRRRFSVWPAALISGALFGLAHYQGLDFFLIIPGLMVVGVVLAMVYERRQSLLASAAAHATFNLIGYLAILHGR